MSSMTRLAQIGDTHADPCFCTQIIALDYANLQIVIPECRGYGQETPTQVEFFK
jgi:hypothetical protein